MNVLHLLSGGAVGGIETLSKDYIVHSTNHNIVVFLWSDGLIADAMKKINNGSEIISLHAKKREFFSVFYKIKKICIEKEVDVVVAHHADPCSHYCLIRLKKQIKDIRTIAYAHSNASDMLAVRHKFLGAFKKRVLSRSMIMADKVVAISDSVKDSVISCFGVNKNKIAVVYNGIDIAKFKTNKKEVFDSYKIIYVGRLIEQKGVQITLEALSQLKNIDYQLTIVGDGAYKKTLEALAKEFGISNKIVFLGSRLDVPELLKQANIFIHMPVWEEGFGITIIEAMASGLICICANSGAISEIIEDGKSGFIVEKGNVAALVQKLKQVVSMSKDDLKTISRNAVKRAQYFSIERFANNLDNLIEEVTAI